MPTSVSYSPRPAALRLKHIDAAELRIPSTEELRARRSRLLGKPSRDGAPVTKPVAVDWAAYNDGSYTAKVVCGIAAPVLECCAENAADPVSEKPSGDGNFIIPHVDRYEFAPSDFEPPIESAIISEVSPETEEVLDITSLYKMAYSSVETKGAKTRLILRTICDKHGITMEDLLSPRRWAPFAKARQEACYILATERRDLSWPMIGRIINKDHTSAIHAATRYAQIHGLPPVVRK